jgi:integrase
MARTVRDARMETREARRRLAVQEKPHWKVLTPGEVHLGYRRRRNEVPGRWLVRRYKGDGRYEEETLPNIADDFEDADGERVLSFAQAQSKALAQKRPAGSLTVADAIADYITYLRAEKKSANDAEARARKLILPELGKLRVTDLTAARIRRWRDALAARPALVRTAKGQEQRHKPAVDPRARRASTNRTLTILKAALNRSFKDGDVEDDRAWRRVDAFENVQFARPEFCTLEEAKRLVNAAEPGFRELVHGALLTGCRYGELCAMRVRDFQRGKVAVRDSKAGKPRDVVLSDEGVEFFQQVTAGRGRDEPMFCRAGGGPWKASQQARQMIEACRRARIDPPVGFHQLRHTWASHAVMGGMPLMLVARNLGHSSTVMVEKHYGHLAETYVDETIRASAPRFGAVEPTNVRTVVR